MPVVNLPSLHPFFPNSFLYNLHPSFPYFFCFIARLEKSISLCSWPRLGYKQHTHAQFPQFPLENKVSVCVSHAHTHTCTQQTDSRTVETRCTWLQRACFTLIKCVCTIHVWVRAKSSWCHLCLCAKGGMVRERESSGEVCVCVCVAGETVEEGELLPTPHAI